MIEQRLARDVAPVDVFVEERAFERRFLLLL